MTDLETIARLLEEIRDQQLVQVKYAHEQAQLARDEVARFMSNQEKSLANQQVALRSQRATARLYRIVVAVAGVLMAIGIILISRK